MGVYSDVETTRETVSMQMLPHNRNLTACDWGMFTAFRLANSAQHAQKKKKLSCLMCMTKWVFGAVYAIALLNDRLAASPKSQSSAPCKSACRRSSVIQSWALGLLSQSGLSGLHACT